MRKKNEIQPKKKKNKTNNKINEHTYLQVIEETPLL